MAKLRLNHGKSRKFRSLHPDYEIEVLQVYDAMAQTHGDLQLKHLANIFAQLQVPNCFTRDITQCVEYFYSLHGNIIGSSAAKRETTVHLIQQFTVTFQVNADDDIIDILDIDKLTNYTNKLLKYRDNFSLIKASWQLFIPESAVPLSYKLTLSDLKRIKDQFGLEANEVLIDMMACCVSDQDGNIENFDFDVNSQGITKSIKDFACILGDLGEFD